MADRGDLRQHVIALIENGFSASEAAQKCHVPLGQRRGGLINLKFMGSFKDAILQGTRIV